MVEGLCSTYLSVTPIRRRVADEFDLHDGPGEKPTRKRSVDPIASLVSSRNMRVFCDKRLEWLVVRSLESADRRDGIGLMGFHGRVPRTRFALFSQALHSPEMGEARFSGANSRRWSLVRDVDWFGVVHRRVNGRAIGDFSARRAIDGHEAAISFATRFWDASLGYRGDVSGRACGEWPVPNAARGIDARLGRLHFLGL